MVTARSWRAGAVLFAVVSLADTVRVGAAGSPTIVGLTAGQQVKVEGRFAGAGPARVERLRARDADGQVRIESRIDQLDPQGRRLRLLGFSVEVPPSARILDGSIRLPDAAALRAGDRVEVRGTVGKDGGIVANRVRRSPLVGSPRDEIEAPIEVVLNSAAFELLGRRMVLVRGATFVDERAGRPRASALRRDDDEQQVDGLRLGTWGSVGGRVEGIYDDRRNVNLDAAPDRANDVSSMLRVELSAALGPRAQAYAKVDGDTAFALEPRRRVPGQVQVKEANLTVALAGPVALQLGRLRVRDSFEWFADDYVDAARVRVAAGSTTFEAGGSYGIASPATGRSRSDERQLFASFTHEVSRAFVVAVHGLVRDDRTRREQPRWVFTQLSGRTSRLRYWGQGALRRGRSQAATLGGWAVDAGVSVRPFGGGPLVTASYASASGDRDRSDSVDTTFRQTGLEDTETRVAGFKRLHTYGQLLEPSLSNLRVLTLGVGRQWGSVSVDLLHHTYRQQVPRQTPSSSALGVRPTGSAEALGQEVDALLTVRLRGGLDLSVAGGVYLPGQAQAAPSRPAFFWRPQVQLFF